VQDNNSHRPAVQPKCFTQSVMRIIDLSECCWRPEGGECSSTCPDSMLAPGRKGALFQTPGANHHRHTQLTWLHITKGRCN
jgi:hypothetical protein